MYESTQYIFRVKDDGQDFGASSILAVSGFGLLGMSERAEIYTASSGGKTVVADE